MYMSKPNLLRLLLIENLPFFFHISTAFSNSLRQQQKCILFCVCSHIVDVISAIIIIILFFCFSFSLCSHFRMFGVKSFSFFGSYSHNSPLVLWFVVSILLGFWHFSRYVEMLQVKRNEYEKSQRHTMRTNQQNWTSDSAILIPYPNKNNSRMILDFRFVLNVECSIIQYFNRAPNKKKLCSVFRRFQYFAIDSGVAPSHYTHFFFINVGLYFMINCTCVSWLNINVWFDFVLLVPFPFLHPFFSTT